jgi:hypothetical protein
VQPSRDTHSLSELIIELADGLAGIGMFTMTLFPFAIPALALTMVVMLPMLLGTLLCVLVAAPVLFAGRSLGRALLRSRAVHPAAGHGSAPVRGHPESSPESPAGVSR